MSQRQRGRTGQGEEKTNRSGNVKTCDTLRWPHQWVIIGIKRGEAGSKGMESIFLK